MRLLSCILLLAPLLGVVRTAPAFTTDIELRATHLEARDELKWQKNGEGKNSVWHKTIPVSDVSSIKDLYYCAKEGFDWLKTQEDAFHKKTKTTVVAALYDPRSKNVYMSTPPRKGSSTDDTDPSAAPVWHHIWKDINPSRTHAEDGAYILMENAQSFHGAVAKYEHPIGQDNMREGGFMIAIYGVKWGYRDDKTPTQLAVELKTTKGGKVDFCDFCGEIADTLRVFNDFPKVGEKLD